MGSNDDVQPDYQTKTAIDPLSPFLWLEKALQPLNTFHCAFFVRREQADKLNARRRVDF
jgi:hypothetical protein